MNLIYGCMNLGGDWSDGPLTATVRERAFAALDAAWEAGYRSFDHADIYARGKSESVFGEWLATRGIDRNEIGIQSKCGIVPGDPTMYDFSREHILRSVSGSLDRLGVAYLDTLLLHRPDPLVEPEEVAAALDRLRADGRVRAVGVSNHSAMQIELLAHAMDEPIRVNQLEVSLGHPDLIVAGTAVNQRRPETPMRDADTLEYCRRNGITVQAWSPLAQGRYSGREDNPAARRVAALAAEHGVAAEAVVLAWILRHPAGIVPVVGTTNPERIAACAAAESVSLSRAEWYGLLADARGFGMP